MLNIDREFPGRKQQLLTYFRSRAAERMVDIQAQFGANRYEKCAGALNRAVTEERDRLLAQIVQTSQRDSWPNDVTLPATLLTMHCANVAMIEGRNSVWLYDYMSFSRRVGELWEPICTKCFELPPRTDVAFYIPPLFDDVKRRLTNEVHDFINALPLSGEEKAGLLRYYDQVWQLVASGEVNLAADLHVTVGGVKYVIDFKSGFGSNEKGNMNRLLLVASVYKNIEPEEYSCMLLVRSEEDSNNNYLKTLKNSGLWDVKCGASTYEQIHELSGFDLRTWMTQNIDWRADLDAVTVEHLTAKNLLTYLAW